LNICHINLIFVVHFEVHARSNNSETACVLLSWSSKCRAGYMIKRWGQAAFVKFYWVVHSFVALADAKLAICRLETGRDSSAQACKGFVKKCDGHSNYGSPTEL